MTTRVVTSGLAAIIACCPLSVGHAQSQHPRLLTVAEWGCKPVDFGMSAGLASFDKDAGYTVTGTKEEDGRRVRISGDTLLIDTKNLPFVVSDINRGHTGVKEIIFDARRIVVDGPISLRSSDIVFLADEIIFSKNARITFTGPVAQQKEGIRVVANTLVFDPLLKKPLQFVVASEEGGKSRRIEVVANSVKHGDRLVQSYDAEKYLWQRTLSSYTSQNLPSRELWVVKLGKESIGPYMEEFRQKMRWPQYFLTKLLKFHSRNPYDPVNQQELIAKINQYRELLEGWSDGQVSLELHRLQARISANVDLLGYGPNYAPRVALEKQRAAVESQLSDLKTDGGSSYFDMLTHLVLATYDRKQPSEKEVKELQKRVEGADGTLQSFDTEFGSLVNRSHQIAAKFPAVKQGIEAAKRRIERSTQDEIKRNRDAAAAKQGFALAGTAAAIIAAPYVAPEAAAAIGASGSLVGEIVYQHNVGGQTGLTILAAVDNANKYYEDMGKLFGAWESYQKARNDLTKLNNGEIVKDGPAPAEGEPDKRSNLTKSQASGRTAASVGAVLGTFYTLLKSSAPPTAAPLSLDQKEQEDPRLAELIAQLSALNSEQSDIMDKMKSAIENRALASDSLQREKALLDTLLALDPGNDLEVTRWHANAMALWQNAIQKLARDAVVLRRAFQYETGLPIALKTDVLQFSDEMLAATTAGSYDPFTAEADDKETVAKHLASQRTRFSVAISALLREVKFGLDQHLSRGTKLRARRTPFEFRINGSDLASRRFIEALNAQIEVQIAGKMEASRVMPMLIPIRWKSSVSKLPERLIDAKVVYVKFKQKADDIGQSGLAFHIIHPFYGAMYRDGECSIFDMRDSSAIQNSMEFTTDIGAVSSQWLKEQPGVVDISELDNYYARPPSRTDYRMLVQVTSDRWRSLPKIESITIGLEVLQ